MSSVADSVRTQDRDRYLSTLFVPDEKRPHLLGLYAFNAEVTRIPSLVSEPGLGLIRLQWWRDTVASLCTGGSGAGHPVAEALAGAIAAGRLPERALTDLITAHEFDLYDDRMPDLTALEAYLGETQSRLIQMAAMILDRDVAPKASAAAGLAGVAYGLALILGNPARREVFLPRGIDVPAAIAHARTRLTESLALLPGLPKTLLPAFLPVSLTESFLNSIARRPDSPLSVSPLRRQFTLWRTARREFR
jgi:phytoene synthase